MYGARRTRRLGVPFELDRFLIDRSTQRTIGSPTSMRTVAPLDVDGVMPSPVRELANPVVHVPAAPSPHQGGVGR